MGFRPTTRAQISAIARIDVALVHESVDLEQRVSKVYAEFRDPIYRYLAASFGDAAEAEDLTQETFLRLYVHWAKGKSIADASLRSWLFRVAHNLAIDRERHGGFLRCIDHQAAETANLPGPLPTPEQSLLEQERYRGIRNGLALLSPQERQCLNLRAEGLRYREIGQTLEITTSSVAEFLRRAIRKMRERNG